MREWGIDPRAWRNLQSRPLPTEHVKERFHELDYPADALAANVEADAVIRLDVAPDGSVTNCGMVNAGVPKSFEVASCNVLKSAKFKPATDARGKPVSAPIVYDVRFRIGS
jgi:TonB family protein